MTADADVISIVSGLLPLYNASGATGRHQVELFRAGLPNRCDVQVHERTVTVLSADTASVAFQINCVERLHVRTATSGPGDDPDGYVVVVAPDPGVGSDTLEQPIATNESLGIAGVQPGAHTISLTGVSPTCSPTLDSISREISATDSTVVTFTVACPAPPPPASLIARARGESEIRLDWSPAPIPDSIVDFYRVYRDGAVSPLASPDDTTFTDTGLPAGATFCYRVSTVNIDGLEGPRSSEACATTLSDPAVQDSVIYTFDELFITDVGNEVEVSLGSFQIPPHLE
ncbi:MAG: fibronectin type III domain-containing protein, partial [Acidimicrobiia bacterium]|nr:fibronectin type III domain-containing protein [Acidimicrobiia bacterium]